MTITVKELMQDLDNYATYPDAKVVFVDYNGNTYDFKEICTPDEDTLEIAIF